MFADLPLSYRLIAWSFVGLVLVLLVHAFLTVPGK